ncbi:hypothetical protein R3P38DRAFT_3003892 [Favolaschia claudopus]|uniref:F-box domain-containing protein n=1 Tax=Favolaschia claudopus TaxID=2862362 RepID=A0AAW0AKP4_9AGAR
MDSRVGGFSSTHLPTPPQVAEVRDLSRFGNLPTDTAGLRASISVANLEVARYATEIGMLQNELNRLTLERDAFASYAEVCRSALSPVHRMPNELLAYIFKWCFPHKLYSIGYRTRTPAEEVDRICRHHLLELSRVCFRWHYVVMDTPQLWSHLAVDMRVWNECDVPVANLLRMLESSLDRGKQHPLTLDIYAIQPHHHSFFELLSKHAQRWQTALLRGDDGNNGLRPCAGNFSQLKTLTLHGKWTDVEVFRTAPRLREIQRFAYQDLSASVPLSARLSLLLRLPTASSMHLLLDLRQSSIDEPLDLAITSSVHYMYFQLATTAGSTVAACRFLENLTFPCLRSFSLYPPPYKNPPVWNSSHFISLATRSGFDSCLTHLVIHAIVTDAELLRCLEVLPKLLSLSITDCTSPGATQTVITDTLLTQLQCMSDVRCLLVPKLQVLTLKTVLGFTDSVYLDLVRSRAESEGGSMFMANLWWLGARMREVAVETLEEITKLTTTRRELIFNRGDWK